MRKQISKTAKISWMPLVIIALPVMLFLLSGLFHSRAELATNTTVERKIVVFNKTVNRATQDALIKGVGGTKIKSLPLINAAVFSGNKAALNALKTKAEVKRLDDDVLVLTLVMPGVPGVMSKSAQPPQSLPWGVDRVEADQVWAVNSGLTVKVGILDTGIDLKHPDLQTNIRGGINILNPRKNANDDNGHGTHVAGTLAALNNTLGVVGVGPKAHLYAIKVLNHNGSGYLSDVIEGLQWAVGKKLQVINLSLGTKSNVESFHDAVMAVRRAGIVQVAAAGNTGGGVLYPAAYPEVIAVSATDKGNGVAKFSSRGPEIDLAAPGVDIPSTYKGSAYATLSGTSMASPHVAGAAAIVLKTAVGIYDLNGNGKWDPEEVQTKLEATATELGSSGKNLLFGSGLLNVAQANQ